MWQIEPGTFKYPGAAVIGHKRANTAGLAETAIAGLVARQDGLEATEFSVRAIGDKRTAWVLEQEGLPATASTATAIPQQGGRPYAAHGRLHRDHQ